MTEKYSCILRLKTSPKNFEQVLDKVLDSLPYEPNSVYCFFNEFKRPPDKEITFDKDYLLKNVSTEEMKGITSMSIYDTNYKPGQVTPFLRLSFNVAELESDSSISIEWVYFDNLDFLVEKDWIIEHFIDSHTSLSFCYLFNQNDTLEQSKKEESWLKKSWGKRIIHKGIHFQAAPIMYFGNRFEPSLNLNDLTKLGTRYNESVVKVELGDLNSDPKHYRVNQKRFWTKMKLESVLKEYKEKTKTSFTEVLKRRKELSKQK